MIEQRRGLDIFSHVMLILGVAVILLPLYIAVVAATLNDQQIFQVPLGLAPGGQLWHNLIHVWRQGVGPQAVPLSRLLFNSLVMALGITLGKIAVSILSAYAIVYFRFPLRSLFFWLIFITLMLPVEVRIFPTVDVIARLHLMDSYTGLTLPLMASATATFLFRQFFLTIPHELLEAARIDGAGPLRFLWDILLPLSKTNLAALFVITFIYGWNQYLWPILIIDNSAMGTAVAGVRSMISLTDGTTQWNDVMAAMLMTMLPPVAIVLLMQRWFVRGLVDSEK
ncbi:sn-glycerol-3-phosphate ABC transporter permease UgpE [Martelella alba]|uniref:sn-glycerol-3-phosphate transport system permease protein UgpE n=1 Tax=Martelella alba TaxID=2590451 RepID=A0ABY2SNN4_9HYPH|nr:sn-glycerol-3-phosphate ABC transporter permease UgpE [Martelella alba]TKI07144.1 sn-glycerol-3-phosphate ABC transporter permease UgpE [Martelella alba]